MVSKKERGKNKTKTQTRSVSKEHSEIEAIEVPKPAEVKEPRSIEELQEELDRCKGQLVRAVADFRNLQKRVQREREKLVLYTNESLLELLLPVFDHFDRIVKHLQQTAPVDDETRTGMEMVLRELDGALTSIGVKRIDAMGKKFDPRLHEAISTQETKDAEPGSVVQEYQKGYLYRGKLLRPAKVVVAAEPTRKEFASPSLPHQQAFPDFFDEEDTGTQEIPVEFEEEEEMLPLDQVEQEAQSTQSPEQTEPDTKKVAEVSTQVSADTVAQIETDALTKPAEPPQKQDFEFDGEQWELDEGFLDSQNQLPESPESSKKDNKK